MAIVQSSFNGVMPGLVQGWGLGEEVDISSWLGQGLGSKYEAGAAR